MAETKHVEIARTKESFNAPAELNAFQTLALGVGVIGTIVLIAGALLGGPVGIEQALRSYLLGFTFWGGIGIGCLGILILQHLTGGSWGLVIRRILEAGAWTLPLLFVLVLPILILSPQLYEWAAYQMGGHGGDKILDWKAPYLNVTFFAIRSVIYFAIWIAAAYYLRNLSSKQDETGDWKLSTAMSRFSGPALVAFVLALTFAAIDWMMSLDPHWFSTIFGLLYVIGSALSCMAFVIALSFWLSRREPMNHILGSPHFHDLGKLMLAMVMVWAYFNVSQLIIIYSGNLPEETPWYLRRIEGGWGVVAAILILFHFAFPFLLLLSRDLKRQARWLTTVAIFVLVMRLIDLFYLIVPNPMIHGGIEAVKGFHISWMDFVAPLAVGGLWLFYFIMQFKKRPILPFNDPFYENAVAHGREHH